MLVRPGWGAWAGCRMLRVIAPLASLVLHEVGFGKTLAREALANRIWIVLDPGTYILPGFIDPGVRGVIP